MTSKLILLAIAAAAAFGQTPARSPAQAPAVSSKVPRTPDGHPDLQGIWTNVTITPLERAPEFAGKPTLTVAEAKVFENKDSKETLDGDPNSKLLQNAGSAGTGAYNDLWIDRGSQLARVDGVSRTSLVVDPPDGKIPAITDTGRARNAAQRNPNALNSASDRPLAERCILGFGSTGGPPMLPVLYNNNYQIVQTPDTVMILVEMVHDVRTVRMNGTHAPAAVRQYLGDSIGHWEGDTLVVDTTNFTNKTRFRGSSENLHVVERFKRVDAGNILYRATIDDPTTFTKPWTVEFPFVATQGPVYEYACHEGNYALADILSGARKADKEPDK